MPIPTAGASADAVPAATASIAPATATPSEAPDGAASQTPPPAAASPVLALDADGALTTEVIAADGLGASVVLPAGTLVLVAGNEDFGVPPTDSEVILSVRASSDAAEGLPEQVFALGSYTVELTVDGVQSAAEFISPDAGEGPRGGPAAGARLIVTVSKEAISAAGMGILYRLSSPEPPERVATSPVIGDPELHFPIPGSGRYAAGGAEPEPTPAALPDGTYRSVFSIPDAGCVTVVGSTTQICGPSKIDVVQIFEPSTGEFLGACHFRSSDFAATPLWPDGSQFWCQRDQDPASLTTVVTVAANVANLPLLWAEQVRQSDGLTMQTWTVPAEGGLQLPGGGTTPDPYDDRSLPFGGGMFLEFAAIGSDTYRDFKRDAVEAVRAAGYDVSSVRWQRTSQGYLGKFVAQGNKDGRKKIGEDALAQDTWQVDPSGTRGNRGAFIKGSDYRVEHGAGAFVLRGEKCGGHAGPWEITISGDPDPSVDVAGSISFELNDEAKGSADIRFRMTSRIKVGPQTVVSKIATEGTADVELVETDHGTVLRFSNVDQHFTAGGTDGQISVQFEKALNGEAGGLPVERGAFCSEEEQ